MAEGVNSGGWGLPYMKHKIAFAILCMPTPQQTNIAISTYMRTYVYTHVHTHAQTCVLHTYVFCFKGPFRGGLRLNL